MTWTINYEQDSSFFDQFRYPAGELQTRFKPGYTDWGDSHIQIVLRQTFTGDAIIGLAQLVSAIRGVQPTAQIDLVAPYLPYARADRRFVSGDCHGLEAFATLLNAIRFDKVLTLDAHSMTAVQMVDRLMDASALSLINRAIDQFTVHCGAAGMTVLLPDEGAKNRYDIQDLGALRVNVLHCQKRREAATGKLLGFDVPAVTTPYALVVDDLCDGGGTFLGIAEKLPADIKLGLYVTHGVFSRGFADLKKHFDVIYTTDSVKPINTLDAAVYDSVEATISGRAKAAYR